MAFDNFFSNNLSMSASNSDYAGIFGTTAQTLSLSSNLGSLSAEGSEIVRWIRYRLGEPKITVELDNVQIFSAFEEANIEYSALINRFAARNWLGSLMGSSNNFAVDDYTNKLPHETMAYLKRLAQPYATEAGVGGLQTPRKAYVTQTGDATDYNLMTDFVDDSSGMTIDAYISGLSAAKITVRKVYYSEPATIYRFYDPYSSTNALNQEFQYESIPNETIFQIMPIWTDILRAGMLETQDRIRRSNVTYHIYGDRLRLLPKPTRNLKVWIEYTVDPMDPFNPDFSASGGDPSTNGISSIANVPFKDIKYEDINAQGKRWIRQYALAVSMETLGRIRRKYSTIPVPNSEVTLDGDALVAEGQEKQEQLRERMLEELEETSNLNILQRDAEQAAAIEEQMQRIPFASPILFIG